MPEVVSVFFIVANLWKEAGNRHQIKVNYN